MARTVAEVFRSIPFVGRGLARCYLAVRANSRDRSTFSGSATYWERRYTAGGDSGSGSYGRYARFKAEVLNRFISEVSVTSVIEFGCGDGNQLGLVSYPQYLGFDVSDHAIEICRGRFKSDPTKSFLPLREYTGQRADLALSLDVIYHLVEDEAYFAHMGLLFGAAESFVIVYSSNVDAAGSAKAHVRHRKFSDWLDSHAPDWRLLRCIANPFDRSQTAADFYVYTREPVESSGL
jgi:SAM-dependent methyltransferase